MIAAVVVVAAVVAVVVVFAVVVSAAVSVVVVVVMVVQQTTVVALALCHTLVKDEYHKGCRDSHEQGHVSTDIDRYVCQGQIDIYGWMRKRTTDIYQGKQNRIPGSAGQA